jgi:SpoVK/Ycf46/Vps4 family AAA+-type ATPase
MKNTEKTAFELWFDQSMKNTGLKLVRVNDIECELTLTPFEITLLLEAVEELSKKDDNDFGQEFIESVDTKLTSALHKGMKIKPEKVRKRSNHTRERDSRPDKGVLIAGVPGCGKSMITKAIETEYSDNKNVEIVKIYHGKFMRGSVGSAAREMHNFFDEIRKGGKDMVLLIDEIDVLFPRRGNCGILANERTSTFLSEFD